MQRAWEVAERLRARPPAPEAPAGDGTRASPGRRSALGGLAAASVAAVLGGGAVLWAPRTRSYRTGVGERRTAEPADGSSVQLNTASALKVAMRSSRREVRLLEGEAHFQVRRNPARPFFVDAGSARLRVVGTAFNVRLRDRDVVELTVTEGVVAVVSAGSPHLGVGEAAVIDAGAVAALQLDSQALRRRTAWRTGVIEFHGETLAAVVEEFNRYQVHPIIIGDPEVAAIRVGGRFQVDEADKFLAAISSSFPIEVIRTGDGVLVTPRRSDSSSPT